MLLGIVTSLTAGGLSGCGQETKAEAESQEKMEKAETEKGKSEAEPAEDKPTAAVTEHPQFIPGRCPQACAGRGRQRDLQSVQGAC